MVNVELLPLCSTKFSSGGPPSEEAQSLGEFLNGLMSNSSILSLDQLKVNIKHHNAKEGDEEDVDSIPPLVWYVYADLYCLNYDGSITDATLISLVSALQNRKFSSFSSCDETSDHRVCGWE